MSLNGGTWIARNSGAINGEQHFQHEGAMLAMNEWTTRYMQTAAIDFGTSIIARAIESISTVLDNFEKGA